MTGLIRIVKGNEYPFKIYIDKMGYTSGGTLSGAPVDLREVLNLKVFAIHAYCRKELIPTVASDGSYLTVVLPTDCELPFGNWGIRVTGTLNGLKVASAERAVFSLVKWNGQDYVPPTIVDGEGSYVLNMKFGSSDSDTPVIPGTGSEGWIGFKTFSVSNPPVSSDVSDIDLSTDLTHVDSITGRFNLTNTTQGARMVIVAPQNTSLSFMIGGLPAVMAGHVTYNGNIYYFSDELSPALFIVDIS